MRIFTNHTLIRRNHNLGRALVFIGLGTLAVGFVLSFTNPEAVLVVMAAALVGTLVSQAGITFLNRWGRNPRTDEMIDAAMKGLDNRFSVFHFSLGADHLVTGTAGTYAINARTEEGDILYEGESFYQVRPRSGLLRRGGRSELRSLESDAAKQAESAKAALLSNLDPPEEIAVVPMTVFLSDSVNVRTDPEVNGQIVLHRSKLKDWLRHASGGTRLNKTKVKQLADTLGLEAE